MKRTIGISRLLPLFLLCGIIAGLIGGCDNFNLSLEEFAARQAKLAANPGGGPETPTDEPPGPPVTPPPVDPLPPVDPPPPVDPLPPVNPPPPSTPVAKRGILKYNSLKEALDAAPVGSTGNIDEIILVQSIVLPEGTETAGYTIDKYIRIKAESGSVIIQRKSGFTGSLFQVNTNAALYLGAAASGGGEELVIDGQKNTVTAQGPLVNVSGGRLDIGYGAVLQNNRNAGYAVTGGAVYINSGTINISGGTIRDNISGAVGGNSVGGGIAAMGGSIVMNAGTIARNIASKLPGSNTSANFSDYGLGGQVYLAGGTFTLNGGFIGGNTLSANFNAKEGGGVYAATSGVTAAFTMNGGEIRNNKAYEGGGVYLSALSDFAISGGALIDANNDVYFYNSGSPIIVNSVLTQNPAARITFADADYVMGTKVLTGSAVSTEYAKFKVTRPSNSSEDWEIDVGGGIYGP
ncbi:hypothetical protein AGMMS50268_18650 [Spirochaetia bacterium]|nr:hypothetical protein AGMMS50268_18650 [Spirochaetia bacterium]